MHNIVVVNNPKELKFEIDNVEIVSARDYLTDIKYAEIKNTRVFNLSRSYRYQSVGYYVSLLAEARGHRVIPSITTIQDLKLQSIIRVISDDIDELIQSSLRKIQTEKFNLNIYFGQSIAKEYEKLSKHLYNLFQSPLLSVQFVYNKSWNIQNITSISFKDIPEDDLQYVMEFAKQYFGKKQFRTAKRNISTYDMAILLNPDEKVPPSNKKAIKNFIEAGEACGFSVDIITKDDFSRIPEFDALFIRETTAVNHHTYRFSRRASAEGLIVIDDPQSILRCTNKVYLSELLTKAKILTPKTVVVHKDKKDIIEKELQLPCILKQPDGAFSQGVVKIESYECLDKALERLFDKSDLIIAQAFVPSEFDWRIGIFNKMVIYASKYYMAKDHWQIYNWEANKKYAGDDESVPIDKVPAHILQTALKAANLIGDGLYGVDLKEIGDKAIVIEVNDNPTIDSGVEDTYLKDQLYALIMKMFKQRVEQGRR